MPDNLVGASAPTTEVVNIKDNINSEESNNFFMFYNLLSFSMIEFNNSEILICTFVSKMVLPGDK